jgi:hypothetical protein
MRLRRPGWGMDIIGDGCGASERTSGVERRCARAMLGSLEDGPLKETHIRIRIEQCLALSRR